jgi:hypothetical protein
VNRIGQPPFAVGFFENQLFPVRRRHGEFRDVVLGDVKHFLRLLRALVRVILSAAAVLREKQRHARGEEQHDQHDGGLEIHGF